MEPSEPVKGYEPSGTLYSFFLGLVALGFLTMILVNGFMVATGMNQFAVLGTPYFFITLLLIQIPLLVPALGIFLMLTALYIIIFSYALLKGKRTGTRTYQGNPVTFIGISMPFLYFLSVVIVDAEALFGVQTGGPAITSAYTFYLNLIYAPFVEELGFRIIPLGILVLLEAIYYLNRFNARNEQKQAFTARLILYAFLFPGKLKKKLNFKMGTVEWIGVILTALLFGYAHYYFGSWDPGKIAQAALVGAFLAIGFLKFGAYVDIIMHWFFNGFISFVLFFNTPASNFLSLINVLWLLLCGIAAVVYVVRWHNSSNPVMSENNSLP